MGTVALPRTVPSALGVDAAGILAFVDALDAAPQIEPHGLVLLRHGHVVAEGWWSPYAPERPHQLHSLSKSFTSTALGLAVREGRVSLDDTVLHYFPEFDADVTDPRSRRILVRHVAAMASGHTEETLGRAIEADPEDILRGFLLVPPDREPGTVFAYNQPCTHALARIVSRVAGQSLVDYLRPRLFEPLGITRATWQRDRQGRELGFTGLHVTTDAIARLGMLYLGHGTWRGRRLLGEAWVAEATGRRIATSFQAGPDWRHGYGYQFWQSRHGFRGDGALGQFCLVLPEHDAVLAITASTQDMQAVLDAAWEHVVPALAAPCPSVTSVTAPDARPTGADAALAHRLAHLALPPVTASPVPPGGTASRWNGFRGSVTAPTGALGAVAVTGDGARWRLALTGSEHPGFPSEAALTGAAPTGHGEAGLHLDVALGTTGWVVSQPPGRGGAPVPVATSGGWTAPGVLRFDVLFLETPYRVAVTCSLDDGVTARWVAEPLFPTPLDELRAPRG